MIKQNEINDYGIPKDGKILIPGDTYLLKMDMLNKGSQSNFNHFISILDKKLGKNKPPFEFYIYMLACICNQYGVDKGRTNELIWEKFKEHSNVYKECFNPPYFKEILQGILDDIYERYASAHGTWHSEKEEGDKEVTPTLPEQIFQDLPPALKNLTKYFSAERERDAFLLSALCVLSSFFPWIKGNYDNNLVGMNLFIFISAPGSAGKGVMMWARRLAEVLHKDLESNYRQQVSEYEEAMRQYNEAKSNGQEAILPIKPERKLFLIPTNSSAIKVIQTLKANGNFGVMFDTEADTLAQTFGNDWGNFSDILRKIFQHEPIELLRKTNDEYVSIEKSFMSLVLSGTPNQINNLLSGVENGFFSRFIFYDFPLSIVWKNVFDRTVESPDGEFHSMAIRLMLYFNKMAEKTAENENYAILFSLNPYQENQFNEWFSKKQEQLHHIYGEQIIASIRRLGLITFRIAMILTTMRYINHDIPNELLCSDTDFNTALSITDTLLCHTTKIFNQLKRQNRMKSASGRKSFFLEKLPDTFNRATSMEIASLVGIKEKTAEHYITCFINEGLIERAEHNHYKKL